jgi:hypothetical protein
MLYVMLLAAHLQLASLPKVVSFDQLFRLAVLCDKYDAAPPFKTFVPGWVAPYEADALTAGFEEWLSVAWAFGYEHLVDLAQHLVYNCLKIAPGPW